MKDIIPLEEELKRLKKSLEGLIDDKARRNIERLIRRTDKKISTIMGRN